ncbi:uncharacterized protein FOMMEDRAFT_16325, partial [Fomitiporia mediterranea MF3/22]|uniref:uncharacterized protein n=1 Tax=Fomitiporia mediterranea (strain MF3/22) TaxID=694068 RepID=UPI0004408D74
MLEKDELERKLEELGEKLAVRDKELADERNERMRDKERWKQRMADVENGVEQIVFDLEKRAQDAETKAAAFQGVELQLQDTQAKLNGANMECQRLKRRVEEAEQLAAVNKAVGSSLVSTDDTSVKLEQAQQLLIHQLEAKERALTSLEASMSDKEKEVTSLRNIIRDLESSLRVSRETIETHQQDAKDLRKEQRDLKDDLRSAQSTIDRLKADSNQARSFEMRLSEVQDKFTECKETLEIANERLAMSSDELDKARLTVQQLENAL